MTLAINQHWVPQTYLKFFATPETKNTDNPQVWIFSKEKEGGDPKVTSIKKICAKRYLYSPLDLDGRREQELENRLGHLESLFSDMWPTIADDYMDLMQHQSIRKFIALFASLLHLRHPDNLMKVTQMHQYIVEICEETPKRTDDTPDIDWIEINGERHTVDTSGWDEYRNWNKNDHHKFFSNMVHANAIYLAELFLKKRWSIIVADKPAFVTSDKPVAKHHQKRETFGFGTERSMVLFPLSPTRLLVMDDMHQEPAGQYYPLKNNDPGPLNFLIWQSCGRFMISPRNVDEVLLEIARSAQ